MGACQAHLVILDDLGDEVAGVGEVAHDGHAHAQDEDVGVLAQQALHQRLHAHTQAAALSSLSGS